MITLGTGEILLLLISVVMAAFFLFSIIIRPKIEQNKSELYHCVTTKVGDCVYSETKIFKGSFVDETYKDQTFFTSDMPPQAQGFVKPVHSQYLMNDLETDFISGVRQQDFHENNLYKMTGERGYYLQEQTKNQAGKIYEVV